MKSRTPNKSADVFHESKSIWGIQRILRMCVWRSDTKTRPFILNRIIWISKSRSAFQHMIWCASSALVRVCRDDFHVRFACLADLLRQISWILALSLLLANNINFQRFHRTLSQPAGRTPTFYSTLRVSRRIDYTDIDSESIRDYRFSQITTTDS